jgi:hypothetical protein
MTAEESVWWTVPTMISYNGAVITDLKEIVILNNLDLEQHMNCMSIA